MIEFCIPDKHRHSNGIYKISNSINKMVYIGRTSDFYRRYSAHRRSFADASCNSKFCSFIERHPEAVFYFSLVELVDEIKEREEFYILRYNSVNEGFNVLYNDDDVFKLPNWWLNVKTKKPNGVRLELQTIEALKRGYIRTIEGLVYKPRTASGIMCFVGQEQPRRQPKARSPYNSELDKVINSIVEKMKGVAA